MASCAHAPHPEFQDSDLRRLIAWFPGAYDLRSLSWAHVCVWGAAGGCHAPPGVELVDAADFDHVRAHVGADLRACAVSINQLETSLRALEMGRDQSMRGTGAMPITFV